MTAATTALEVAFRWTGVGRDGAGAGGQFTIDPAALPDRIARSYEAGYQTLTVTRGDVIAARIETIDGIRTWWAEGDPELSGILTGVPATTTVRGLVDLARRGGLRPHVDPQPTRGLYRVLLSGPGKDSLFGALHVSVKTGRLVRANLCHGNHGQEKSYRLVAEVRTVLASWLALWAEPEAAAPEPPYEKLVAPSGFHNHYRCKGDCAGRPMTLADRELITGTSHRQYDHTHGGTTFCTDCLEDLPRGLAQLGHICAAPAPEGHLS